NTRNSSSDAYTLRLTCFIRAWLEVLPNTHSIATPTMADNTASPTTGGAQEKAAKNSFNSPSIAELKRSIKLLKHALPDHARRVLHAELAQDRGGDVVQLRIVRRDFAVRKEHAWHQVAGHAVIADPGLRVVFDRIPGNGAERGLPARAIPAVEAHKD